MVYKELYTLLGFIIFITGFIAIILSMVGLSLTVLKPIDEFNRLLGFVIRIVMIFGGLTMMYVSRTRSIE